jgi:hypothetical protein
MFAVATMGATVVVAVNVVLGPIARAIERQPTESRDVPRDGMVEVSAELTTDGRDDTRLDQAVNA